MKRVRFETPTKPLHYVGMNDFECQSPRPFIEKRTVPVEPRCNYGFAEFSNDSVQRYETANSSPYPMMSKTHLEEFSQTGSEWSPSNDLELSMLDSCRHVAINISKPESNIYSHSIGDKIRDMNIIKLNMESNIGNNVKTNSRVLTSLENTYPNSPNVLNKHDDFFLRRDNLKNLYLQSTQSIDSHFKKMSIDKENNPYVAKSELLKECTSKSLNTVDKLGSETPENQIVAVQDHCNWCHCKKGDSVTGQSVPFRNISVSSQNLHSSYNTHSCHQHLMSKPCGNCTCHIPVCNKFLQKCSCGTEKSFVKDRNTVDKKTWALEKYENSNGTPTLDIEKEGNLKEKREPTVSDLFKIIKLQNQQLQLLQDKVDKFISASKLDAQKQPLPLQKNYITSSSITNNEHMSLESVGKESHKISIGVMTSFEMVRTSTIINKEIVKQSSEAQIQCNRSQISMKEIIQPDNIKFLDGIRPMVKNNRGLESGSLCKISNIQQESEIFHKDNGIEEKTLNELSLYNVQVDNAITPLMSPDQSLYLDVRDYSDSESELEDQSNVGWTYYNKVMTHVNGMLHDSDMPSSASALYRNTRQKCMQMKIDKTNVSVIKRVKFGDDPVGVIQQAPTTDTSLKMNQLAAKYLKKSIPSVPQASQKPTADMSLATRNYMEKHQLLQGIRPQPVQTVEIPRFLDITALKQQPKLL